MLTHVPISCVLLPNLASYPALHHVLDNGLGACTEYLQIRLFHSQPEPLGTRVVQRLKLCISVIIVHPTLLYFSLLVWLFSFVHLYDFEP